MYANPNQKDWCMFLPLINHAYNVSVQSSTHISPFSIMFAREPIIRSDSVLNVNLLRDDLDLNSRTVANNIRIAKALDNIRVAQIRQKRLYDRKVKFRNYEPGELVLVYHPRNMTRVGSKLSRLYLGPYKIITKLRNNNFVVAKVGRSNARRIVYHHNALKPFRLRV